MDADPTSAQMRAARASGRTPGLSTADEPAAAPLGTDDEAAGTPPSPASLRHEIERASQGDGMRGLPAEESMSGRPGRSSQQVGGLGRLMVIGTAVVIVVALAILLF